MSRGSIAPDDPQAPQILKYAAAGRGNPLWRRFAADIRPPLAGMALLAVIMCVVFPIWRLAASREGYVAHLSDDAFYYFSVAPNLAAGKGPTADGITMTTGWHPLYGFLLAGIYRLTHPSLDGFPKEAIALNAVLYLCSAYVLYLAGKCWWGRTAGILAALLWLTSGHGVYIAASGLESSLYILCLSLLLWRLADFATRRRAMGGYLRGCVVVGVCAAFTVLARTDSVLLMPLVMLILLAAGRTRSGVPASPDVADPSMPPTDRSATLSQHSSPLRADFHAPPSWRVCLMGIGVFGLLIAAAYGGWLAYVHHYTGELHQGSAAVKMEWRKFLMRGKPPWAVLGFTLGMWSEFAVLAFFKVPALKWLLAGVPLLWTTTRNQAERGLLHLLCITPVVLGLAYGLLLEWARAWYSMPAMLTLTLLAAGAGTAVLRNSSGPGPQGPGRRSLDRLRRLVRNTLGLILWAAVLESGITFARAVYAEPLADAGKLSPVRVAEWLEQNVEPHTRIGCWHSGIIGYYTPHLDVINLDGLNNNDILLILRGDRLLNPYWDKVGITVLAPPQDVDPRTGEVCRKMGRFKWQWDHKRLVRWSDAPGVGKSDRPLDLYDQILRQMIYRVVEVPQAGPATKPEAVGHKQAQRSEQRIEERRQR